MTAGETLDEVLHDLRACRVCRDTPRYLPPLPHQPRPVIQASATARLCVAGQAPGTRVHASGQPFTDASGVRLRRWLGIGETVFYDAGRVAVVPMGHCFPGQDAKGGDLPPRRECAPLWRERVFAALPRIELVLAIGRYAQDWHLATGGGTASPRPSPTGASSWRGRCARACCRCRIHPGATTPGCA